jgi:hypothetical protein
MTFHGITWEPIAGLPPDWLSVLVDSPTHALVESWKTQASELRQEELYKDFLVRLGREWAIETGVIEGLYDISEAGTKTLIEQGFQASFLSHDDTNQPVADVISRIRDQFDALQGLYAFISGNRPLGTSYIKELHRILTAHQPTYQAFDTLGNRVERELPRGVWKLLPNNVQHPDGTKFEFCPPEHVSAEMDRLIELYRQQEALGVPPDIQAAWLHHRFTLIHPFTDGNGRVARCLATLVLLKAEWLPLVVTRTDRNSYIEALRRADNGDLRALVDVFAKLQRIAIRNAFSLTDRVLGEAPALEALIEKAKEKVEGQAKQSTLAWERSLQLADSLCESARVRMLDIGTRLQSALTSPAFAVQVRIDAGLRTDAAKQHWFYQQVIEAAKKLGYFADRQRYSAWTRLQILTDHKTEILLAFHGIGKHPSNVLGAALMAYSRSRTLRDDDESPSGEIRLLSEEPFEFTPDEDSVAVQQRFQRWIEDGILRGIDFWQSAI